MSEDSIQVIMIKLEHMESLISQIHEEGKRMQTVIATSVISGGILAGVVWFVTQAI